MRFKILYLLIISFILAGCGGNPTRPAPVEDGLQSREAARARKPIVVAPAQRGAPSQAEMLFQVLAAIGVDYRYGGSTPQTGFDCSGLVAHVFQEGYGIMLPRTSQGQSKVGTPVSLDQLQPGDLVFYNTQHRPYSHVGIYLGEGRFVHAPKTGSEVRIENIANSYWARHWNGARRIAVGM